MNKRRILSIMMAVTMVLLCAVPTLAAEPTKISFTLWGTNEGLASVFALADEFNATHPEIQVTVNGITPDVYFQKLNAFFASGDAPDVIQVAADYGDEFISRAYSCRLTSS
jgi:putative chitobiose transport system substrate-binding protein